jgi:carboxymethylenebutenolidase
MPPTPKERAAEQREPRQGGGPTSAENPSPAAAATPESSGERIISLHAGYDCNGRFVDGYMARPRDERPRPGVVMLSGMRGLTWTQRELTRLFARAGFVALSPDYLGRRPKTVAEGLAAKNALSVETAIEQLAAGSRFLKSLPWVGAEGNVGIMGFCLGGGLALLALAETDDFDAAAIYHHSLFPDARDLAGIDGPIICHYGTDDEATPREEVDAFTRTLDSLGKSYERHWYEGMGHNFAQIPSDADVPASQRAAATASHERTFRFLHTTLAPTATSSQE